jgi:cytochrome c oxidase subunit IV
MFETTDAQKHEANTEPNDSIAKYFVVYFCILLLAGLQVVVAYQHITLMGTVTRMMLIAIAEAFLALVFFMHLWAERLGFLLSVLLFVGFVIFAMQDSWTDSFRIKFGVPGGRPNAEVVK